MVDRRSGIYKILNKITDKFYIGSATDFYERWHSHKHYLSKLNHHNVHLQRAWIKYGELAFEFIILEICDTTKLEEIEQRWIDKTNCCDRDIGYNINKIANSAFGVKRSPETIAKMSAWQTGTYLSEEHKEKLSIAHLGKEMSDEARAKLRNFDKWPCDAGSKCKCQNCKNKRNVLVQDWKLKRNY